MHQQIGFFLIAFRQVDVHVQMGAEQLREPVFPHHILEKIMVEHLGDPSQQIDVDAWAVENGVNVGPLAVDLPRELRNTHVFLVKNRLDQATNMKFLVHPIFLGAQR